MHRVALVAVGLLWASTAALADPWIVPGDTGLRHDLALLADRGVIRAPLSTWPLSWGDISADLQREYADARLDSAGRAALMRVRARATQALRRTGMTPGLRLSLAEEPRRLRDFSSTPRDPGEVQGSLAWTGLRFSYRLQVTAVSEPLDERNVRTDGSYAGVVLGNWMFSAGNMDRWWGPGWNGGLIMSSNARPVPVLAMRRNYSDPFKTPLLGWMGPWTMSVLYGQLEGNREIPNARLFGVRLNFRPLSSLEIGLSRTAQWCGSSRPCGLGTFGELLLGIDNRGENTNIDEEPGNQLGGIDWRWTLPFFNGSTAFYGEAIGEDEASNLPSRYIGQLGVETAGYIDRWDASWRVHVEIADTAAEFYSDPTRFDYAYEHFIYSDGYRYHGRATGHTMDADGRMLAIGSYLRDRKGNEWQFRVRHFELNRREEVSLPHT
ncbi:MAG: capsule assembly Wzi family protein, partial [Halioglobus sp.]|nr:capsule assembly Wzi family protein [Halioglobus sp.]